MSVPDSDAYVNDDGNEVFYGEDSDSGDDGGNGGGFTLPNVLSAFASNPRNFILGAVLTSILEGVFGVVTTLVDAVLLALGGSRPFEYSPAEAQWGLADVPPLIADYLTDSGSTVGGAVLDAVQALNDPLFNAAGAAGPFGPVLAAAIVAAEVIALLWIGERIIRVLIDAIPGGGGLL